MKKILRTVLDRNILHTTKLRKVNFIGHIWRSNCLPKQDIEGKLEGRIEVRRRQERRCKKLVEHLKKKRGTVDCKKKHYVYIAV
jgi:hypothetical protein